MLRIHRAHPDSGFTMLSNTALQDDRLSWAARGILVEILSRPDGWNTNADALWQKARRTRNCRVAEGRGVVRSLFLELEALGYLVRTQVKAERGKIVTIVDIYDTPGHGNSKASASEHDDRGTVGRSSAGRSSDGRASATRSSIESTDHQRTDQERESDKDSSSLADARAAAASASARSRETQLNELYEAVERLDDTTLRNTLTTFENKRPRIYRQCRRKTAGQYNEKDRSLLRGEDRGRLADTLSYKYALRHYFDTADEWPAWLIRPLLSRVHLKSVS